jgi:uncharacterized membrane protein
MILNRLVFILSVAGLVVAAFLWSMHSHPQDIPCSLHVTPENDCASVARSIYSRFPFGSGPPVAAWGTFGYLALATFAFLRTTTEDLKRQRFYLGLSVLCVTVGLAAALGLTYAELFIIHKICKWCMASQGIIAAIFLLNLTEWLQPTLKKK